MPQLDPPFPSFTLVLNQAYSSGRPSTCHSSHIQGNRPSPQFRPTRLEDPLMTTVDQRFGDPSSFPLISWVDDSWELEEPAANLQTALEYWQCVADPPIMKRRLRFSALVVDLALTIRRKCQRILPGRKSNTAARALASITNLQKL